MGVKEMLKLIVGVVFLHTLAYISAGNSPLSGGYSNSYYVKPRGQNIYETERVAWRHLDGGMYIEANTWNMVVGNIERGDSAIMAYNPKNRMCVYIIPQSLFEREGPFYIVETNNLLFDRAISLPFYPIRYLNRVPNIGPVVERIRNYFKSKGDEVNWHSTEGDGYRNSLLYEPIKKEIRVLAIKPNRAGVRKAWLGDFGGIKKLNRVELNRMIHNLVPPTPELPKDKRANNALERCKIITERFKPAIR